jgi:hypothetical protein
LTYSILEQEEWWLGSIYTRLGLRRVETLVQVRHKLAYVGGEALCVQLLAGLDTGLVRHTRVLLPLLSSTILVFGPWLLGLLLLPTNGIYDVQAAQLVLDGTLFFNLGSNNKKKIEVIELYLASALAS